MAFWNTKFGRGCLITADYSLKPFVAANRAIQERINNPQEVADYKLLLKGFKLLNKVQKVECGDKNVPKMIRKIMKMTSKLENIDMPEAENLCLCFEIEIERIRPPQRKESFDNINEMKEKLTKLISNIEVIAQQEIYNVG